MMEGKEELSHSCKSQKFSSKFVFPISFVSLFICVTTLVRVEIINQRVHVIENLIAEVHVHQASKQEAANGVSHSVKSVGSFGYDFNTKQQWKDDTYGKVNTFITLQIELCNQHLSGHCDSPPEFKAKRLYIIHWNLLPCSLDNQNSYLLLIIPIHYYDCKRLKYIFT